MDLWENSPLVTISKLFCLRLNNTDLHRFFVVLQTYSFLLSVLFSVSVVNCFFHCFTYDCMLNLCNNAFLLQFPTGRTCTQINFKGNQSVIISKIYVFNLTQRERNGSVSLKPFCPLLKKSSDNPYLKICDLFLRIPLWKKIYSFTPFLSTFGTPSTIFFSLIKNSSDKI